MLDLESRFEARVSGICSVAAAIAASAAATIGSSLIGASASKSAAQTQANAADQAAQVQMNMYNQTRGDLMPYMQTGQNALSQLANLWGIGPGGGAGGGGGGYGGFGGGGTTYPNAQYGASGQTINIPGYGQVTIPAGAFGGAAGGGVGGGYGGGGGTGIPNAAAATQALTQFPGYQFGLSQGVTALDRSAAARGLVLSGAQLQDAQTFGQQYGMQQAWTPYVTELGALATTGEDAAAKTGANAMTTGANVGSSLISAGQATAAGQVGVANQLQGGIQNALLAYQMYGQGGMNPALTGSVIGSGYSTPTAIDTSGMGADLAAPISF